jgi:hypothetical protein
MGSPVVKYPPEALKDYLLKNPNATLEDIAVAFSGKMTGVKKALYRHKIKLSAIPDRVRPLKCSREKLEAYLSTHPDATAMETAKALNAGIANLYVFAKRYGITFVNKYHRRKSSPPLSSQ